LSETFDKYRSLIRKELQKRVAEIPPSLSSYVRYHFGWEDIKGKPADYSSGKMVRPLFCLLSCEACGGNISRALSAACSIELVHNFSLVHDDIEDSSVERHHRPALWKAFGLAPAINAGDALFTMGYHSLVVDSRNGVDHKSTGDCSGEHIKELLRILTHACLDLCEGQNLDLLLENKLEVTVEEYFHMIQRKTAALFEASARMGSLVGGADDFVINCFQNFGLKLGIAFQIQDDILGIWGERERTGKSVSDDIMDKKKTLPVLFSLNQEKKRGQRKLRKIYGSAKIDPEQVPVVVEILNEYEAKAYCLSRANSFYEEALSSLRETGLGSSTLEKLEGLSKSCLGRN